MPVCECSQSSSRRPLGEQHCTAPVIVAPDENLSVAEMCEMLLAEVGKDVRIVFNNRLDVRDASGATPLSYQPAYLDPLGRSVRLQIRKMFIPRWRRPG